MKYTAVRLRYKAKCVILALGADGKSGFCLVKGRSACVYNFDKSLADINNLKAFEKELKQALKAKPGVIACDIHPGYISTALAEEIASKHKIDIKHIQHHEAHIASCIAENDIKGDVIGVAFDGTGLGHDGNIWGGEFFMGSIRGFKRAAHLKYAVMPGGESSIREPWRMAFSFIYDIYGASIKNVNANFLKRHDKAEIILLKQIIDKKLNSPLSSGMGRLFDAVSSLIGIRDVAEYEAQAAIELEKAIEDSVSDPKAPGKYAFDYKRDNEVIVIDWAPVIKGIMKDLRAGKSKSVISLKFHSAVCNMIKDVCESLRKKCAINQVCLSGGVFQNKYISANATAILENRGFCVYSHKRIPVHDGNISLGQAVLAGR
ncbi:MAG: hypothetical protein KKH08_04450 [Candidatus Omnitrophica bacterium]|nr:hypothetical protein [Candidatus Omnitrophota bacterium]